MKETLNVPNVSIHILLKPDLIMADNVISAKVIVIFLSVKAYLSESDEMKKMVIDMYLKEWDLVLLVGY